MKKINQYLWITFGAVSLIWYVLASTLYCDESYVPFTTALLLNWPIVLVPFVGLASYLTKQFNKTNSTANNSQKKKGIILGAFCGVIILSFIFPWGFITELQIEQKVISDSIKQFNIAMRTENYMDAYVQAGIITAAHLQAEDEAGYLKWKEVEKKLGRKLGMSF